MQMLPMRSTQHLTTQAGSQAGFVTYLHGFNHQCRHWLLLNPTDHHETDAGLARSLIIQESLLIICNLGYVTK